MKTVKRLGLAAILTASLVFASCSGDDGGGGSTSGFHLKAKVDGDNYSNSSMFEPTAVVTNNVLMIQSSDNNGNAMQIQIPNYTGPGTYNSGNNNLLNGFINYLEAGATPGQFTSYTSVRGDGVVEVTEETETEVRGTFSATAFENVDGSTNSVEITDGSFRAEKSSF